METRINNSSTLGLKDEDYIYMYWQKIWEATKKYDWVEYNQKEVDAYSCSIHWAMTCATALTRYEFSLEERKELWIQALKVWAKSKVGWTVQWAMKLVSRYMNDIWYDITYWRLAYWDFMEALNLWYCISTWYRVMEWFKEDRLDDWVINMSQWDYDNFKWWHCIAITLVNNEVVVVDNYKWRKYNIFAVEDIVEMCKKRIFFSNGYFYSWKEQLHWYQWLTLKQKIEKLRNRNK